jgi:hypothetical protein
MKVLLELLVFCVPKMCQPSYRVKQQEERYFLVNEKGKKIVFRHRESNPGLAGTVQ